MVDHDKYCGRSLTCQQYLYCADYVDQCFKKKEELKGDENKREYVLAAEKKTGSKADFNTCLKLARLFAIGQGRPANFTKAAEEKKCGEADRAEPDPSADLAWQGEYKMVCDPRDQSGFSCKVDGSSCNDKDRAEQIFELADDANDLFSERLTLAQVEGLVRGEDHVYVRWPKSTSKAGNVSPNAIFLDFGGKKTVTDYVSEPKGAARVFELSGYLMCRIIKKEPAK